jgi:hypothetical protein
MVRETARSSSAFDFRVDKGLGEMAVRCHHQSVTRSHNFTFGVQGGSFKEPPFSKVPKLATRTKGKGVAEVVRSDAFGC